MITLRTTKSLRVLVACEYSGAVRDAFIALGHKAVSCDFLPTEVDGPHYQGDVRDILYDSWDLVISHPTCTYLTGAAAWALQDPNYIRYPGIGYHQSISPDTLVGKARREAQEEAKEFVRLLAASPAKHKCIENPVGAVRSLLKWPCQIVQPYQFGHDASKATGLSLYNLPTLRYTQMIHPRVVKGYSRWGNQTDSGQNKLSPGPDRWRERSRTYPGIADAMAKQWSAYILRHKCT